VVLNELTTFLQTQGLGTQGTDLFYGIVPDTPDALIALLEYPGRQSEPLLGTKTLGLVYPKIQALTRGVINDYDTPRILIQSVVTQFVTILNGSLPGFLSVEPLADPFYLKRDDNFRCYFACNFLVTKQPSTS